MDRQDLELVVAVRNHGSLAAAARSLDLAAPVVTKRLAALEARLGQRLFHRTTRRVSATAEGELMCRRAGDLLAGFQTLEAELRERLSEPAGLVRLASSFGFGRQWVGPALAAFRQMYPGVQVELQLTEHLPDLTSQSFDGAVWLWSVGRLRSGEWTSRRLARNQRVLVASAEYLHRRGAPTHPEDLASHDCIVVRENREPGARFDTWSLQRERDRLPMRIQVQGPLITNSGELARDWCLSGQGIMLRSLWDVAPRLASGELQRVLAGWSMNDADVYWIAPFRARTPRRVRLLVDHLAERFREEPWRVRA